MKLCFNLAGTLLILLSLIHLGFPKRFHWKEELARLSLFNKQMTEVHTFFIALTVFFIGLTSILFKEDLTSTPFGKYISLCFALFWFIRLGVQLFYYSPTLWKNKRFETAMHLVFSLFWTFLTTLYFWAWYS